MSEKNANANKMQELIKKAWNDEAFKARLLSDTHAALKEQGIAVPAGVTIKAVENTPTMVHILLPQNPHIELTDSQLEQISGGACISSCLEGDIPAQPPSNRCMTGISVNIA
ncbi:NHLP leader peptide family RiPP precursor [Candidatus Magnetominusculus xianensis]|uniref:NHLP leader peptide family natural product n=1 Tax=Candidatus Magnetominusculus xianensis TaxID=1748249 RepID=A0ABR5SGA3_9BACT|nr:NHLP leader peptide family RiPP precursor [Candidatus Magnetominusculus xianensis]KWT78333.1 NHLP leader peptide family natural product precursor [Candidatus Magnetominusculus xianensis]MBF0402871.1 NHLP leader peptide family RiPP precursor [Nitrospirota bacterium]